MNTKYIHRYSAGFLTALVVMLWMVAGGTVAAQTIPFELFKTVSADTAYPGDTLTYTVRATYPTAPGAWIEPVFDNIPVILDYIPGGATGNPIFDATYNRLRWSLSGSGPADTVTVTFRAVIDPNALGDSSVIANIVFVPGGAGARDTANTVIISRPVPPELTISKEVNVDSAYAGDTLTYTLAVANVGTVAIDNSVVIDTVPALTVFVDADNGGRYDDASGTVTWTTKSLQPGESVTLNFRAAIEKTAPDSAVIPNVAFISTPDSAWSDTVITIVKPHVVIPPELEIIKRVDSTLASRFSTLTYTLTVQNVGTVVADSIIVVDTVPAYTNFISATNGGLYDVVKRTINWITGSLNPGATIDLSFEATIAGAAPDSAVIPNVAFITSPDTAQSDTVITIVRPRAIPPELEISKLVDSSEASPKSILTYAIHVTNMGSKPVSDISVEDDIPTLTTYVAESANLNGIYDPDGNQLAWTIASLGVEHSVDLIFQVKIDAEAPDSSRITNIASIITPITKDSDPAITIVRVPTGGEDLVIVKAVDLSVAAPRDTLHYTLNVTNTGEETVDDVLIADTVSSLVALVPGSITAGGTYDSETRVVSWTLASIDAAASVPLGFAVTVNAEIPDNTDIINRANILAPVPIAGNQVITTVRRDVFDLIKTVDKPNATNTDTLTYTIHYANTAGKPKLNVIITDTLAPHLIYIEGSATSGGTYDAETRVLSWNLGNLLEGAEGDLRFRVRFDDEVVNLETIANAAVAVGDNLPAMISEPVIVTIRFPVGYLIKTANPSRATAGDTITYAVMLTNRGSGAIIGATLSDNLPDGFSLVVGSVTVDGAIVDVENNDPLTIPVGTIPATRTVTIRYRAAVASTTPAGTYTNLANLTGTNASGSPVSYGPVSADVTLTTPLLTITKTAGSPTGETGRMIRYTIAVTNSADVTAHQVVLTDVMPNGFIYMPGSTTIDGRAAADPSGQNPYQWSLGNVPAGETITIRYMVQLGANVSPGNAENTAWAEAQSGNETIRSPKATATVYVITPTLTGMIRGKVIVDCNNDGIQDVDTIPSGMDVYLDDGSQSRVNNQGMFYFSAVRAGERVVALDERDLTGFVLPGEESSSVLVHVDENGESYVTFAICPEAPRLVIAKYASVVPRVKVTKTARMNAARKADTTGVLIDYEITLKSNGGIDPTRVRVIDSFPSETRLIIHENQSIIPTQNNNILTYDLTVAKQRMAQSVYYSLQDLAPGIRAFLTNKIHLECDQLVANQTQGPIISAPTEVSVGPFKRIPPHDISLEVIGALFETSKAYLRPEAIPVLTTLADSMQKYDGAPVKVEGHADYRRIHTREFPSNWELSTARAKSVVDWLVKTGGIDSTRITYEGFAATRPRDTGRTPEALQRNRRVEVFLRGRLEGKVDLSGLTADQWSASTMLEMVPIAWDTILTAPPEPLEAGLDDLWEIRILVENTGLIATDNAVLADNLPAGTEIVEGSTSVDGKPASFRTDPVTGRLGLDLGRLEKGQKVEVKYRIRALSGSRPTGGGPAEVKTTGPANKTIETKSNPVSFH
ncbi:MAG: OmpA family protein [candidate division Zixibacteria bacterium]|nr:OmpA family protein [candidate division Zixibacteria bacterium]